jgi:hypothetical protein
MFRRRVSGSAADVLRPLLFGNVPMDQWLADGDSAPTEVSQAFADARSAIHRGDVQRAVSLWTTIANTQHIEQRQVLQAWTFLRSNGVTPEPALAATVLGVVVEVPVGAGVDVLAGYRDSTARYLNHSGKVAIIEGMSEFTPLIDSLVDAGQELSSRIGPWDKADLPALPSDHARVTMLTAGGFRFGQGPDLALRNEAIARPVFAAATALLVSIVSWST